jgi:hypothetical protein
LFIPTNLGMLILAFVMNQRTPHGGTMLYTHQTTHALYAPVPSWVGYITERQV